MIKNLGTDRVAQVVECLPRKCNALSSNPAPQKTNKQKTTWIAKSKGGAGRGDACL
jgi:hypothetical protein